ncbi:MAG: CoA-binding protein [Bacteroidota bacterium]
MPNLQTLFATAQTIAVVGCSPKPSRTSHQIARYLQQVGYRMIPVHPKATEILGAPCYPTVSAIPADVQVDIVNVFRQSAYTAGVVRDVIARRDATGQAPTIWTQLGVSSPEARAMAEEAGLPYVHERCIMVDHRMLT